MAFIVHGASPFGVLSDVGGGPEIHQPNADNHLLCVGCGNFRAASQEELREHYKSEWHRHNLKRKLANLAPIGVQEFEQRVQAYLGEPAERSKKKEHLGNKAREKAEKRAAKLQARSEGGENEAGSRETALPSTQEDGPADIEDMTEEEFMEWKLKNSIKLSPGDSLFDRHSCDDLATNLEYMASKFGFFVPYLEHVEDLPALIDYIGQKVSVGNVCLWCNKAFRSLEGVQKHMVDKGHCKVCLEGNEDEFQDFYAIALEDDEDGWETDEEEEVDEEMEEPAGEDEMRNRKGRLAVAAQLSHKLCRNAQELAVSSKDGTKVLGHRAFNKYYRQSLRPLRDSNREGTSKVVALLMDTYNRGGVVTKFQGSTREAKANRQQQKVDRNFDEKNVLRVQIRKNKFHQIRRSDYHA